VVISLPGLAAEGHRTLTGKTTLKQLMRSGFAISCVGHVAVVTLGFIFAGANPFDSKPADAIMVDIVSADEVETNSSKPVAAPADAAATAPSSEPVTAAPQPQSTPPTPQATPPPPDPAATRQALAPTQAIPSAPSFNPWPQPPAEQLPSPQPDESNLANVFGMPLTMPGGMIGDEYHGLASEKPDIPDDAIAAFRKHLKACSMLPAGVTAEAKLTLRIHLNPDGTLTKGPDQNPHAVGTVYGVSVGGGDLYMAAMAAVRKCQPYKMLPPDRYDEWKTLDLTFTRENF